MTLCKHTTTEGGVTRHCTEPAGHSGAHFGAVLVKAVVNGPDYGGMGENPGIQDSGLIPLPYPQSEPRPLFTARGDVMPPPQSGPQVVSAEGGVFVSEAELLTIRKCLNDMDYWLMANNAQKRRVPVLDLLEWVNDKLRAF